MPHSNIRFEPAKGICGEVNLWAISEVNTFGLKYFANDSRPEGTLINLATVSTPGQKVQFERSAIHNRDRRTGNMQVLYLEA